jgi:hypothetical protein
MCFIPSRSSSPAAEATTTTDPGPRYGERLSCSSTSSFLSTQLLGVYYRAFFDDGAVPTLHPATPDDPFLGRVLATSIAPPHNVYSIKCGLAKHEDIDNGHMSDLFLTRSSRQPISESLITRTSWGNTTTGINIFEPGGAGYTPENALAVVVKLPYVLSDDLAELRDHRAFVNYNGPTGIRRKKFLLCFHHCPLLTLGPIIYKSTTGCTTRVANCHRECLSTRSSLQSGASGRNGLHRPIQSPL